MDFLKFGDKYSEVLTHCMLGKISADDILKYFSYDSYKIGSDTSCKLSPKETICMKCQLLFSRKSKLNISSLTSAEFAHSLVFLVFKYCS